MNKKTRILLIDDGDTYAEMISGVEEFQLISPKDSQDNWIKDGKAAIAFLEQNREPIDVILLDMNFDIDPELLFELDGGASLRRTKRFQGVAILREIHARFPHIPVVLLTSYEDLSLVDAAQDLTSQSMTYVLDSHDVDSLKVRINSVTEITRLSDDGPILWGDDSKMKSLQRRLTVLSNGGMPVILEGETGTGKSYLAERFVHAKSKRTGPFVVLDLSTVPENLISAHLFGAVKGAYTGAVESRKGVFEIANQGTLFIDEIQNAPLDVQKQLLLVLQDKKVRPLGATKEMVVDVKVVAASNKPLDKAVSSGTFRSDLYMRLSPATRVRIPPLRERLSDLEILAKGFTVRAVHNRDVSQLVSQVARALGLSSEFKIKLEIGRPNKNSSEDALSLVIPKPVWKMLKEHSWPGNIRELEMLIYNMVTFTLVDAIDAINRGIKLTSNKLQVDTGLVGNLLQGATALMPDADTSGEPLKENQLLINLNTRATLNEVANDVERQYFLSLFKKCKRDFAKMSHLLLGDAKKARAVRLRFNQLGLKVREIE